MIAKVSLAALLVSLVGCGGSNAKDPRMEKIMKDREASRNSGDGVAFGLPPETIPGSGNGGAGGGNNPGGGSGGAGNGSSTNGGSGGSGSGGSNSPGSGGSSGGSSGDSGSRGPSSSVANIAFYCSKDSTNQIGTSMHKATGVSFKVFNMSGAVVAEDGDMGRAQSRRTSILTAKTADISFGASVADGLYYIAFCDASQHAACTIPADRRSDPIDKDDGKYSKSIVGYADNVSIQGNKIIAVGKTEVLFPLPQTQAEKEACSKVDSPLIIDTAGDGIALTSMSSGVSFDIDADGAKNETAWTVDADDAFLALDLNGNGSIDSGAELFGNHSIGPDGQKSANGFLSLAKYDENRDGKIDAADSVFAKLRLWFDKNHNGISEADELVSLEDAGIVSISLDYVELVERDSHGNEIRQRGLVQFKDKERVIVDAWLRRL